MFFILTIFLCLQFSVKASEKETIDLTGLVTGGDVTHDHIYEQKYNNTQHWTECFMCHDKQNIKKHNLTSYWVLGVENCHSGNSKETYCKDGCGYKDSYIKLHNFTGSIGTNYNQHFNLCIGGCSSVGNVEKCYTMKNGVKVLLNCNSFGICDICKNVYNNTSTHNVNNKLGTCIGCGLNNLLSYTNYSLTYDSNNVATVSITITPSLGVTLPSNWKCWTNSPTAIDISPVTITSLQNGSQRLTVKVNFINNIIKTSSFVWTGTARMSDGRTIRVDGCGPGYSYQFLSPDRTAPTFTSLTATGNGTINNFSRKATIQATVTETQDNIVYMRLLDTDGVTVLSDWGAASKSGTSFTKLFDIVAEIREPATLYVETKDSSNNINKKAIQVQYIDAKAPELTCNLSYKENWSKTKKIDFTSKDSGVGNVSVAFNNLNTYQLSDKLGDSYSHPITFKGDVYENVIGAVYIKDELGNQRMQKVEIGKLDNTIPTITTDTVTVDTDNRTATITVEANDINSLLKASGSGVTRYSLVEAGQSAGKFQSENSFTINKNGFYDIYVSDLVGNISQPRRIEVKGIPLQVTCKDVLKGTNTVLGEQSSYAVIGSSLTGSSYGSDITKNIYYKGYVYDSASTIIVSESETIVYRYFLPLYQIGTSINNGTITSSGIDIVQGESYPITYKANLGSYIAKVIVDGLEVPIKDILTNYMFTNITSSHTIQVETRVFPTVTISKEIRKDNANFNSGNPIFQFKIEGTDYLGKTQFYTKYLEFTETELSGTGKWQKSLTLTDIEPGTYEITELPVKDYVLNKIENIKNTTIENKIVNIDTYNYNNSSYVSESILKGKAVNADSDSKLNIFEE